MNFFILIYLSVPLIISGILHMVVVTVNWPRWGRIPLSSRYFGANKTWRGIYVMVILCNLSALLLTQTYTLNELSNHQLFWNSHLINYSQWWVWGSLLGLAYCLGELPNSLWKRRKGIAEGLLPSGKDKILHAFVDQADSIVACSLTYLLFWKLSLIQVVLLCIAGTGVHLLLNLLLFSLKLRKNPL